MNTKHLVVSAALLAIPLAGVATQPALATAALTGNFSVALSGSGLQNDTLSIENSGSGKSNFSETLSNHNQTMTGSFSEPLTNGSLSYGAEFFDINISAEDPTLTISFSSLFDGTSSTSCTTSCTYTTSFDSSGFSPGAVTATFADGKSLTIALSDDDGSKDIVGNIQLTLNSPTGVAEPGSLALFGSALVGFGAIRRRQRKTA